MKFIQGNNRDQIFLFPVSLEERIEADNLVWAVDAFMESLPLKALEFKVDFVENGNPAYHPKDFLKLLIYGYLNKTRSSREYGTIKRQWGFSYILSKKGENRASADVGLMYMAYNLRRIISILGFCGMLTALFIMCSYLLGTFATFRAKTGHFATLEIFARKLSTSYTTYLKHAYI